MLGSMKFLSRRSTLSPLLRILQGYDQTNSTWLARNISASIARKFSSATLAEIDSRVDTEVPMVPHIVSIIKTAQQFDFSELDVKRVLVAQPELMQTSFHSWNNVIKLLQYSGFDNYSISSILVNWPEVLTLKEKDLEKNLQAWVNTDFGQELCVEVLTTYPSFLKVNHNHVSKRVKQFQLHFESKKRVGKLFLLAPNTLEEKWNILSEKFNYLDELCTEKSDVVGTGVLAHNIFHIKARHEFLIRAGLYKRPQKDFRKRLSKNPNLDKIVNTTDEKFLANVAKLSVFEYEVFLEMFQKELMEEEDDDDDDDSDSDIDS